MAGLFGDQNACTSLGRLKRCSKARNPAARNHHIKMGVGIFIAVRVRLFRGRSQPSGPTDHGFKQVLPERAGMNERLVIESRGKEGGHRRIDRTHIKFQTWKPILRDGFQARIELGRCGAIVRLKPATLARAHQGVRFFGTCRHNSARTVVFKGPADQHLVIRQQSRGERVACKSRQAFAVKGEILFLAAIDEPTTRG